MCVGGWLSADAQYKGVVKGRVLDGITQEAVPFASVVVLGTSQGVAADEEGYYRLEGVKPGYVRLEVSSVGYKTLVTGEFLVNTAAERTEENGKKLFPLRSERELYGRAAGRRKTSPRAPVRSNRGADRRRDSPACSPPEFFRPRQRAAFLARSFLNQFRYKYSFS